MRKLIPRAVLLVAMLVVCAGIAQAQGGYKEGVVTNSAGRPVGGALVAVCVSGATAGTTNTPCSPLATIYTNQGLTSTAPNPFQADGLGNYTFWAAPGVYQIQFYGPTVNVTMLVTIVPCIPGGTGCGGGGGGSPGPPLLSLQSNVGGVLTGVPNSSFNTVTGALNLPLVGNVAIKNGVADGVCYASTTGSDANDGLSWGTAKLTVSGCLVSLPGGSAPIIGKGTVYFTDGTSGSPVSGADLWVMGTTDPNYSTPPAGWLKNPGGGVGVSIIGVSKGNYGVGPTAPKAILGGGNSADINHPCIWISGVNSEMRFENIQCNFQGRPIVVGEDSNHSRSGANDGGSSGLTFVNVGAAPNTIVGQGPAWDIVGGSFWLNFFYCFGQGTDQVNTPTNNNAAAFLFDGTGNDGVGEVYLDHISVTSGGIKVLPGTVNSSVNMFEVDHVEGESLHAPALVWLAGQMQAVGIHDAVANDSIGTLCNGGVCAIRNDGSIADNLAVSGALLGSGLPPVLGPMIEVGGAFDLVGQPGVTASFLRQGLRGVIGSHLVGTSDVSRRQFGPTSVRFANTVLSPASYIVIPGTTLTQNVADPSGGTGATRLTATGPGEGVYVASQSGITVNVGDWFVFGAWVHSFTSNGYATSGNPLSIGISSCTTTYNNYPGFVGTPMPSYGGDGEWEWISTAIQVATVSGGACQPNITVSADATHTLDLFGPVYFHVPTASAPSANEMLEVANNLQSYDRSCVVGTSCNVSTETLNVAGGLGCAFKTVSASYQLTAQDCVVNITGTSAVTITVPHALLNNFWTVTNGSTAGATLQSDTGNFNGSGTVALATLTTASDIHCDATNCWANLPGTSAGGSSIFLSYQFGSNAAITGTNNYVQLTATSPIVAGTQTGSGSIGSPYVQPITCPTCLTETGSYVKGATAIGSTSSSLLQTSVQSIDCTAYGVVGNGSIDDTAAVQTCANALTSGGTMKFPSGLTVLMTSGSGLPITFPHTPVIVDCSGGASYGTATTIFETASAALLFRVGTINNGSAQQSGVLFKGCGFSDSSAGHNTALGAILVTDTNNAGVENSAFVNFNRPAIATPSAPAIAGGGAGATSFLVQIVCVNDAGGKTPYSAEASLASNSNPLTVTAPTSVGCPAPSTGYLVLATTSTTGTETLQAATGCTLNASGTGCGLTNNWSGTVTSGTLTEAAFKYDTSAGFGIMTDSQSGANGTSQDASYGHWDNNTFNNMQESFINNGGIQYLSGNHFAAAAIYNALANKYQASQLFAYGNEQEIANTTTARGVILNSSSSSHWEGKFEGVTPANTNITCAEVNSSRNFLGGSWIKCGVALIQENAGFGANTYDIHQQVSNLASPLISGASTNDIILSDTSNGGIPTTLPSLIVNAVGTSPSPNPVCPNGTGGALTTSGCTGGGGGSGTVNAASQYSIGCYLNAGSASVISGCAAPSSPNGVTYYWTSTPAGGVATATVASQAGVVPRTVSGTSDTILAADRAGKVLYTSNSAVAVTLPQAGSANFASNFVTLIAYTGTNILTITPTTSTINSAATLTMGQNDFCFIYSDNTNYQANCTNGGGTTPVVADTGSANAYVVAYPLIQSLQTGAFVWFTVANPNSAASTIAVNGLTTKNLTKNGAAALILGDLTTTNIYLAMYDGSEWQLINPSSGTFGNFAAHKWLGNNTASSVPATPSFIGGSDTGPQMYATDSGATNAYVIAPTPAITALTPGAWAWFVTANANSGASTINVSGLGVKGLDKKGATALVNGDILASPAAYLIIYDGTEWQVANPSTSSGGANNCAVTKSAAYYASTGTTVSCLGEADLSQYQFVADSGVANAYVMTLTVPLAGLTTGNFVWFNTTHPNTGASTVNVSGLGVKNITFGGTNALRGGEILSGIQYMLQWDGTEWQLLNPSVLYTGGTPPACAGTPAGPGCFTEGTAATPVANVDDLHADSTQKGLEINNNNTGEMMLSRSTCVNVSPVTVAANVTTDQNLMTCTLSANLLNVVGRTIHVHAAGIYSTAATSTAQVTIKAKLCTVSGCGSGTVISLINIQTVAIGSLTIANNNWNLDFYATTQTAGATAAFESHGQLVIDLGSLTSTADSTYGDTNATTVSSIDTTAGLFLQITGAYSAASTSNSMSQRQGIEEVLN